MAGHLRLPVGDARQGFVDAEDIAAVAATVLMTDDYLGGVLELTGPEALSFREAVDTIGSVLGRPARPFADYATDAAARGVWGGSAR